MKRRCCLSDNGSPWDPFALSNRRVRQVPLGLFFSPWKWIFDYIYFKNFNGKTPFISKVLMRKHKSRRRPRGFIEMEHWWLKWNTGGAGVLLTINWPTLGKAYLIIRPNGLYPGVCVRRGGVFSPTPLYQQPMGFIPCVGICLMWN